MLVKAIHASPLRRVDSVNTFKRQLKTVLFVQAFKLFDF